MAMGYHDRNYLTKPTYFDWSLAIKSSRMIFRPKTIKVIITFLTVYLAINIHAQFFSFHHKLIPIVSINIFVKKILFTQRKRKKDINCNFRLLPVDAVYLHLLYFIFSMQFCLDYDLICGKILVLL